jgi:SsrA-binding protein
MRVKKVVNVQIKNRRASFDYHLSDNYTAGLELTGPEVHAIRKGRFGFVDSFCYFQNNELYLKGSQVTGIGNDHIERDRKLLLNRKELNKIQKAMDKGVTIVPLRLFEIGGWFKLEIAIGRGKKNYDKRDSIKDRDIKRDIDRELKK